MKKDETKNTEYERAEMVPMSDLEMENYNGGGGVLIVPIAVIALVVGYIAAIGVEVLWEHVVAPKTDLYKGPYT
ncbi:MAG: hypothetical protein J5517_06415 [Eubacterium sp.]|nr:hypothetical protein [Eubacterium sp.]